MYKTIFLAITGYVILGALTFHIAKDKTDTDVAVFASILWPVFWLDVASNS